METVWVSKGDDQRLIDRKQLSSYRGNGYEKCDAPDQSPKVDDSEKPKTGLVTLYKDGQECFCNKTQLAVMEAAGWSTVEKGSTDAGHELEGRKLDQEHGSGGHGEEPGDDAVGVEQSPRKRGNRPYRRKRGNDEDS